MKTPNWLKLKYPVLLAVAISCQQAEPARPVFTERAFLDHVQRLSGDEFLGRAPATPGETKTVEYITHQFSKSGLTGPGQGASMIQPVPVIAYRVDKSSVSFRIKANNSVRSLRYLDDLMIWPDANDSHIELSERELVYVGYGIHAPEENWDDYKGVDLRGKVLVFKNNDPHSDTGRFKGTTRLYYGRWEYKFEMARKFGAVGAIIVHTTPTAGYPWSVVANSWEKEQFKLVENNDSAKTVFSAWTSLEASEQLFRMAGLSLAEMLESAESPDFQPQVLRGVTVETSLNTTFRNLSIKNVLGVVEGSDPILKSDWIVLLAHHDHLGIGTPVQGDSIFNGALDNASGIAALLNLADAFGTTPIPAKRSILFLATSGEEKGLLGSKFWSQNPTISPSTIVAAINMDGMNISGKTRDVVSIGLRRSTLDETLEKFASRQGRYVRPEPRPDLGIFYRSDHFPLAKIGIPVLYLNTGRDFIDKPDDYYETTLLQYIGERYHSVFDEVTDFWDVSGAVQDIELIYNVVWELANQPVWPTWMPGDEFERARQKWRPSPAQN